jgi:hypothetical protein
MTKNGVTKEEAESIIENSEAFRSYEALEGIVDKMATDVAWAENTEEGKK